MADHLTPAENAMIDAIVDPIRRERAAAPGLAARYDSACDAVTEQYDEIVKLRRQVESLEDQLADARAEATRESALVSEARHERDTARQEAREARREAFDLITGDRSDVLHWAVRQLRATPMPTALTGPYWYGKGWQEAINYLEHDLGGMPTDAQVEMAEMAEEIGRLRAQLAALPAPHQAPPVQHIDIYESSYYDVAAALEQAAEDREPITVTTCNGTVTTYRAVPLDTRPHRAEGQQATETKETDETRPM